MSDRKANTKKRGDYVYRTINGEVKKYRILFNKRQLKLGIRKIAKDIYEYCKKNNIKQVIFVGIAIGAIHFMADVERAIYYEADKQRHKNGERFNIEIKTTIIAMIKNYQGDQEVNFGRTITHSPQIDAKDKVVFIFDNLQTTGNTMKAAIEEIKKLNPQKILIAICVDTINNSDILPDFYALKYKERKVYLYGYGLDDDDAIRGDCYILESA